MTNNDGEYLEDLTVLQRLEAANVDIRRLEKLIVDLRLENARLASDFNALSDTHDRMRSAVLEKLEAIEWVITGMIEAGATHKQRDGMDMLLKYLVTETYRYIVSFERRTNIPF